MIRSAAIRNHTIALRFQEKNRKMFLDHVNISVIDLEESIAFYQDLFDWRVRWRGKTTFGKPAAHVGDGEQYIGLIQVASDDPQLPDYSRPGLNHFGIVVDSLEKARETLAKRGISPHNEPEYEPGRRFYFFDPNGVEVELIDYDDGSQT